MAHEQAIAFEPVKAKMQAVATTASGLAIRFFIPPFPVTRGSQSLSAPSLYIERLSVLFLHYTNRDSNLKAALPVMPPAVIRRAVSSHPGI
jgi:hypothetical protein